MSSPTFVYPTNLTLSYTNDEEYRKSIRNLFQMKSDSYPDIVHSDIDEVSRDELEYDENSAYSAMEYVFENTRNVPIFIAMYEQAASFMFSTDINIGMAVLFSYDYLLLFHNCLREYFASVSRNDGPFTIENEQCKLLHIHLFKKR
jgi:hypothetical protein